MSEKRKQLEDEAKELFFDLSRMQDVLDPSVSENYFVLKYVTQREQDERDREQSSGQSIFDYELKEARKEKRWNQL